jgi:hypothetical protein
MVPERTGYLATAGNQRRQQFVSRAHNARIELSSFRVYRVSLLPPMIESINGDPSIVAEGLTRAHVAISLRMRHFYSSRRHHGVHL